MKTKLIAPSILSADFANLGNEVKAVEKAGADWIHVDVMDGHFVPNLTIGPVVVEALSKVTKLPLDVHLMITHPEKYIEAFVKSGASFLTIHAEAEVQLLKAITTIQKLGVKAGVSINPDTSVDVLTEVIPYVDLILVMSVNPGFGGQEFIENSIAKVEKLNQIRKEKKYKFLIEIDGGIKSSTAGKVSKAGCDIFVAGSAIFKSKNYSDAIESIRKNL